MKKDFKVAIFLGYKSIVNGNKGIVILMIFILSLAFVNLIFINSLLNGVTTTLNNQIINNSAGNIVIGPQEEPTRQNYIVHTTELRQKIESLPGVAATAVHYNLVATFAYDKDKNGQWKYGLWPVVGINPEEEPAVTGISRHIVAGDYLEGLGTDDIILGSEIAGGYETGEEVKSLGGVKVGEKVTVDFGNGISKKYTVAGISKVKSTIVDQSAYITVKEAQSILQLSDDRASQILVKINKTGDEDWYIKKIQEIAPNLKVRKWSEYSSGFSSIPDSFNLIATLIGAVGLIVAATTIFILIYINTVNKRRQIGILKAIGIKENIIIVSYILQAFFYVIFGIVIGIVAMFCFVRPYFINHPLALSLGDVSLTIKKVQVLQSVCGLLAIALIAGFVPAWRAVKENILKAIWGA
jgi:putative ABC transport system permease protein